MTLALAKKTKTWTQTRMLCLKPYDSWDRCWDCAKVFCEGRGLMAPQVVELPASAMPAAIGPSRPELIPDVIQGYVDRKKARE